MKLRLKIFLQIILFVSAIGLLSSCDRKSCVDVVCPTNQTCFNGECQCSPGLEGDFCDQYTYEKYVNRTYRVSENCTTNTQGNLNQTYSSTFYQSGRIDVIQIGNISNLGFSLDATIASKNLLYIYQQQLGGIEVSGGEGEYNEFNRTLRLEYQYSSLGNLRQCTAIFTPF